MATPPVPSFRVLDVAGELIFQWPESTSTESDPPPLSGASSNTTTSEFLAWLTRISSKSELFSALTPLSFFSLSGTDTGDVLAPDLPFVEELEKSRETVEQADEEDNILLLTLTIRRAPDIRPAISVADLSVSYGDSGMWLENFDRNPTLVVRNWFVLLNAIADPAGNEGDGGTVARVLASGKERGEEQWTREEFVFVVSEWLDCWGEEDRGGGEDAGARPLLRKDHRRATLWEAAREAGCWPVMRLIQEKELEEAFQCD